MGGPNQNLFFMFFLFFLLNFWVRYIRFWMLFTILLNVGYILYFNGEEKYFSRYRTFYCDKTRPDKRTSSEVVYSFLNLLEEFFTKTSTFLKSLASCNPVKNRKQFFKLPIIKLDILIFWKIFQAGQNLAFWQGYCDINCKLLEWMV